MKKTKALIINLIYIIESDEERKVFLKDCENQRFVPSSSTITKLQEEEE